MQCTSCGGGLEWNGPNARCPRCGATFSYANGQLVPGGGAPGGYGAPPAGGFGGPPPQMGMGPQGYGQQPQHDVGQGTFDMGGGHQVQFSINGKTPEQYAKDKASSMIWGWVIGAVILGVIVLVFVGVGIYVYAAAREGGGGGGASSPLNEEKQAAAAKWDGKSTFLCSGNDAITLEGVKATVGDVAIKASANCNLTLKNVALTAPVGIEASGNAKVTVIGGSINAATKAISASANAQVNVSGATVTGKVEKKGLAKVTGAS